MSEPTPEIVRSFWHHMTRHYAARVVNKQDAFEMQLVSVFLAQLRIVNRASFLQQYATTIGRRIYVPFTIGESNAVWNLWSQMVICVHELQHVVQYDELGALRYTWQYLTSTANRARLEAEAYRSNLELHFWRTGQLPDVRELASQLRAYGVTEADVRVAETLLRMSGESVRRGAIINPTTKVALDWLNTYGAHLRVGGARS